MSSDLELHHAFAPAPSPEPPRSEVRCKCGHSRKVHIGGLACGNKIPQCACERYAPPSPSPAQTPPASPEPPRSEVDSPVCKGCDNIYNLREGDDTGYCDPCAQDLVLELRADLLAAREEIERLRGTISAKADAVFNETIVNVLDAAEEYEEHENEATRDSLFGAVYLFQDAGRPGLPQREKAEDGLTKG